MDAQPFGDTSLSKINFKEDVEPGLIERATMRLSESLDGQSVASLARAIGYNPQTLGNLFRKSNLPGHELLWRLWQGKRINPAWVVFGIEPKFLVEENTQTGDRSTEDLILRLAATLPADRRNELCRQILGL